MLSKKEIVLIIVLLTLVTGVMYYFLFLSPKLTEIKATQNSIEAKETEITNSMLIESQYNDAMAVRNDLVSQWENFEEAIPLTFDDAEVLRLLQRVIYPHTKVIDVSFPGYEEPTPATVEEPVMIYTIALNFSVPYDALDDLWTGFSEETLENRIINYHISRNENSETGSVVYGVSLEVDFLTQN